MQLLYLEKTTQESRAIARNHRAMRGTCAESLYLIPGQRSEQKQRKLSGNMGKLSKYHFKTHSPMHR